MPAHPRIALAVAALASAACHRLSDREAVDLVRRYNHAVTDAYRAADPRLVESVAGPAEAKKLTALIGVKADMGITLDAELVDFRPLAVERAGNEVVVLTEERWYYQDRRVGTGERVGQDSTDHYVMRYHLRRPEGRWVVDEIAFEKPPEVGRTEVSNKGEFRALHGVQAPEPGRAQLRSPAVEQMDGGKR